MGVAVVLLVGACGNSTSPKVYVPGTSAEGGESGASSASSQAGAQAGAGAPNAEDGGTTGSSEAPGHPDCTADLAVVSRMFDFECPAEQCQATVEASNCAALPQGVTKTSNERCRLDLRSVTFELSPTRRKICYYANADYDTGSFLVGAEVWDDEGKPCGASGDHVAAGRLVGKCDTPQTSSLCDSAEPDQGAAGAPEVPSPACYNKLGQDCTPCCDPTPPSCAGQPQGYPGFECTSPPEQGNDFCYCSCDGEQWTCDC